MVILQVKSSCHVSMLGNAIHMNVQGGAVVESTMAAAVREDETGSLLRAGNMPLSHLQP